MMKPMEQEKKPRQYLGSLRETFRAFVHTHGKAGELLNQHPDIAQEVHNYQDARVYLETTLAYLDDLSGVKRNAQQAQPLVLVDTEHAAHGTREGYSGGDFPHDPQEIELARQKAGAVILERAKLIRAINQSGEYQTKIFTGVEVDIIQKDGALDLKNPVLDQLDLVVASLHPAEFRAVEGNITKELVLQAYAGVVQNNSIDVLGHPVRHIEELHTQGEISQLPKINEWEPILSAMKEHRVAYEINVRNLSISDYDATVIKRAMQLGCNFSIGFDFHHFENFDKVGRTPIAELLKQDLSDEDRQMLETVRAADNAHNDMEREDLLRKRLSPLQRAELRMLESRGAPNFALFLKLRSILRQLHSLGVRIEQVINTSPERLQEWLDQKHQWQETQALTATRDQISDSETS